MKNSTTLRPATLEVNRKRHGEPTSMPRLRTQDIEALGRLFDRGPLTIPQAYDCGHSDNETTGHGMNRLVAAALVVFSGWNAQDEDALWMITARGKGVIAHRRNSV